MAIPDTAGFARIKLQLPRSHTVSLHERGLMHLVCPVRPFLLGVWIEILIVMVILLVRMEITDVSC
jgi:hypothetical protein